MQQILVFLPNFCHHMTKAHEFLCTLGNWQSSPPDGTVYPAVRHGIAHVTFMGNKWGQQSSEIVLFF